MATIHNYEIHSEEPAMQPPVLVALTDLRRQRWPQALGKILRGMTKTIQAQVIEIDEERKRLLEVHAKKDEDGTSIPVNTWNDLVDAAAFRKDFGEFLKETFEVPGFPIDAVENCELMGETWASPLLEEIELPKKDKDGESSAKDSI